MMKFLILTVLISFSISTYASAGTSDIPALPENNLINQSANEKQIQIAPVAHISFFEKVKSFFGINKNIKSQKEIVGTAEVTSKEVVANSSEEPDFIDLGNNKLDKFPQISESTNTQQPKQDITSIAPESADEKTQVQDQKLSDTISQNKLDNEFQDKAAQRSDLREHSFDPQNSLGSFSNGKWYETLAAQVPAEVATAEKPIEGNNIMPTESSKNPEEIPALPVLPVSQSSLQHDKDVESIKPELITKIKHIRHEPEFDVKKIITRVQPAKKHDDIHAKTEDKSVSEEAGFEKVKFTENEAKVLLLPNDDVVLGRLNIEAAADLMSAYEYIEAFNLNDARDLQLNSHYDIVSFINNYNSTYKVPYHPNDEEIQEYLTYANNACVKSDITTLRIIMDNYKVQNLLDENSGNGILHNAVALNNGNITKFLIMRGVNLNKLNYLNETPLNIAKTNDNEEISALLRRAGAE